MKLDSVLSTAHLNVVQIISHCIKTNDKTFRNADFCQRYYKPKEQRDSICKEEILTIF